MKTVNTLRLKYWTYVFGWIGLIYSTLCIVRPVCQFLKAHTPFALIMEAVSIGILLYLLIQFLRERRTFLIYGLFIIAMVLYTYNLKLLEYPEEKIHYLEYGILGYLFLNALRLHCRPPAAYFWAFILTVLVGWGDEMIQYILPNRYFQWNDVLLNLQAGAMGLILTFLFQRVKKGS
ncbi:MAG: VanZ family protein [Candidatus Omnitrophica bacterium]|nr:VanZ family protein [Candidatus Omnitrophota bacterium]